VQHSPTNHMAVPEVLQSIEAALPLLQPAVEFIEPGARDDLESFSTELYEWLSLVRLGSPRIHPGDSIDPFLCRYQVPGSGDQGKLCKITWQGYLSPLWCRDTLVNVMAALPTKSSWFSFSTTTFSKGVAGDTSECAILRPPNTTGEYLMWEVKCHE